MNGNEYQKAAGRTLSEHLDRVYTEQEIFLAWNALGLTGEAGEVADSLKKGIFHDKGIDVDALKKELGDVLWYIAAIASKLGLTFEDVMQTNVAKLLARYPEGWDPARSHRQGEQA